MKKKFVLSGKNAVLGDIVKQILTKAKEKVLEMETFRDRRDFEAAWRK